MGEGVVGVDGHQAVLGLRHDLLGDDHDVAVGELGVVAEQAASAMSPARSAPTVISGMPSRPKTVRRLMGCPPS